jgi:hypothetical protein
LLRTVAFGCSVGISGWIDVATMTEPSRCELWQHSSQKLATAPLSEPRSQPLEVLFVGLQELDVGAKKTPHAVADLARGDGLADPGDGDQTEDEQDGGAGEECEDVRSFDVAAPGDEEVHGGTLYPGMHGTCPKTSWRRRARSGGRRLDKWAASSCYRHLHCLTFCCRE